MNNFNKMKHTVDKDNNADNNIDKLLFEPNNKDNNEFDHKLNHLQNKNEVKKSITKVKSESKPQEQNPNPNKASVISLDKLESAEPPELEFLKDMGDDTQINSKNEIDKPKQIDISSLPVNELYNETNIQISDKTLIQSIRLIENKMTNNEEHKKKQNEKGFFEKFFNFFSCNECY